MKKSDQIKAIVWESERRCRNRMLAISLGFFGKNNDEIKKNVSIYDAKLQSTIDKDIQNIKTLTNLSQ